MFSCRKIAQNNERKKGFTAPRKISKDFQTIVIQKILFHLRKHETYLKYKNDKKGVLELLVKSYELFNFLKSVNIKVHIRIWKIAEK